MESQFAVVAEISGGEGTREEGGRGMMGEKVRGPGLLTQKQEQFALNLFQGMTQREAWIQAGYSHNYNMAVLDVNASRLAADTKVQLRVAELRAQAATGTIASVEERKQRLTEILRARLTDYQGPDGIQVDSQSPNTGAIESIETVTRTTRDSLAGSITIKRPVVPEALRNEVFERDGHHCVQCGAEENLQLDHIVALSRGGETVKSNLQTLCETCNKHKAGGKKNQAETITRIKLHSPIQAIAELNRMEKVYDTAPTWVTDNRTLNIIVADKETKELLAKVAGRTEALTAPVDNQVMESNNNASDTK